MGWPLRHVNVVHVYNPYGGLVAVAWALEDTIHLHLEKYISAPSADLAEKHFDMLTADLHRTNDTLYVELPWLLSEQVNYEHCSVGLFLPYQTDLVVGYSESAVFIDQLEGDIQIHTCKDRVKIAEHFGSIHIYAVKDIDVTTVLPDNGRCVLTSDRGEVALHIPKTTDADVFLETFYGRVYFSELDFHFLEEKYNKLHGILGTGRGRITASSTVGDIKLRGF